MKQTGDKNMEEGALKKAILEMFAKLGIKLEGIQYKENEELLRILSKKLDEKMSESQDLSEALSEQKEANSQLSESLVDIFKNIEEAAQNFERQKTELNAKYEEKAGQLEVANSMLMKKLLEIRDKVDVAIQTSRRATPEVSRQGSPRSEDNPQLLTEQNLRLLELGRQKSTSLFSTHSDDGEESASQVSKNSSRKGSFSSLEEGSIESESESKSGSESKSNEQSENTSISSQFLTKGKKEMIQEWLKNSNLASESTSGIEWKKELMKYYFKENKKFKEKADEEKAKVLEKFNGLTLEEINAYDISKKSDIGDLGKSKILTTLKKIEQNPGLDEQIKKVTSERLEELNQKNPSTTIKLIGAEVLMMVNEGIKNRT